MQILVTATEQALLMAKIKFSRILHINSQLVLCLTHREKAH
jgi:hypothetical protein